MHLRENNSAVINEYGTNLFKYRTDPLKVLEAKQALFSEVVSQDGKLRTIQEEAELEGVENREVSAENVSTELNSFPSLARDSQEVRMEVWSSQEENIIQIEERKVLNTNGKEIVTGEIGEEVMEQNATIEDVVTGDSNDGEEGEDEDGKAWETSQRKKKSKSKQSQEQAGTRQSQRVKEQGTGQIKAADKVEALVAKKNIEELQQEEDAGKVQQAAQAIKLTALSFHPREPETEGGGVVLLH
ncbi:unnamed protein product [Urochloa decumbens]|uniref:Uncharacterized protein n=1 Tax=Urochloa decumbens TaxID=240449 RepID=A0ABC9BZ78_9POAL